MTRIFALLGCLLLLGAAQAADYDIVIRGGRVLDGAGNPWVRADVAVKDGRIVRVGAVSGRGAREIDAAGLYVAPGFVDMLDQSGSALTENGASESKLRMGVTTLIAGEAGTPVEAAELADWFRRLERQGIAVNFGTYYSSGQARRKVMGEAAGAPAPAQIAAMEREVETAMRAGAFGISSALIYPPSSFQSSEDLIALARVASRCGGYYATHMRDESADLLVAIAEAIRIGEEGGVPVEIFHLKAAYAPGWGRLMPQAVAAIEAARARGVDVAANMYPYTAGGTGIDVTVPTWVWADGREAGLRRLRDPAIRARLKREVAAGSLPGWSNLVHAAGGWRSVVLASAHVPAYARFQGRNFEEIGAELRRDPADVAWDIVVISQPKRATALFFLMDEADVVTGLRQLWVSIGSDAATARPDKGDGLAHPRAYGTFPRVIAEYVRRRNVLTLPDAVRKMTGWPAQRMGLSDRGLIREGMRADILLFDLERLDDVASWANPTGSPTGIRFVIVNGQVALDPGGPTAARAGQVLRHSCTPKTGVVQ